MRTERNYSHVAFADESNWNRGRYRSISLVSCSVESGREYHATLKEMQKQLNCSEFKWTNAQMSQGLALCDFFFKNCDNMRIDVLIWDMEDSRHKNVPLRDDDANFARMYYHLLRNVLAKRWPDEASWKILPDEKSGVDWKKLGTFLDWKRWGKEHGLFRQIYNLPTFKAHYKIRHLTPVSSKDFFMIQLADLFAGVGAFSYKAFERFRQWEQEKSGMRSVFSSGGTGSKINLSRQEKIRFPILKHLRREAGNRKMGVSLDSWCGLRTMKPSNSLNFWLYQPQHEEDKAPRREPQKKK